MGALGRDGRRQVSTRRRLLICSDFVPGYRITESLGLVRGSTIRAKHVGKDIIAGLRTIFGGEIKEYTEMLVESRAESMRRMELQAERLKADAVLNVRFVTSQVMTGAAELLAYGTAVRLEKEA